MKTDNEIEQLLMSGKKLSLSSHEKASIKSALLEHASQSLKQENRAVPSPWTPWVLRGSASFASLLIMFVGTAYASQDSLPGEPLYAMKVHVVEEMIALTKIAPEERVAYDIHLMENRLEEIKEIVNQDSDTMPENLVYLTDQVDEHVTDVITTLEETDSEIISYEDKIEVLKKLSGVAKAQVEIAKETTESTETLEALDETQESTIDAINNTVEEFIAEESTESVNEYLSDQITDVGEYVSASTTNESERDFAEYHLLDVHEALVDGDTKEAIISILEAQQTIEANNYKSDEAGSSNETVEDEGAESN